MKNYTCWNDLANTVVLRGLIVSIKKFFCGYKRNIINIGEIQWKL